MYKEIGFCLAIVAIAGCSSSQNLRKQEIDRAVRAEPAISSPEEIANRAVEILSNAPGITLQQRADLSRIYTEAYLENYSIRTEIGKTTSLLFKVIASKNYKSSEVTQLKNKIRDLDHLRLKKAFKALDDIQAVVGYGANKEDTYKYFEYYDFPLPDDSFSPNNSLMR